MFVKNLIDYIKLVRLVRKVDRNEQLRQNLSALYKSEFREDWVGRWYTVLNPHVQNMTAASEGITSQILEYTENGLSDQAAIEKWCMEKIFVASNFIKNKELLDVLTYSLDKIDDQDNYLFVIKPIVFDDLKRSTKRLLWTLLTLILIGAGVLIFI